MLDLYGATEALTAKHWTFAAFLSAFKTGRLLVVSELLSVFSSNNSANNNWNPQDEQPTGINYMFSVYSRLLAFSGNWIPSFVFDIRAGTGASRLWDILATFFCLATFLVGSAISLALFRNTTQLAAMGLEANAAKFMRYTFYFAQVSYVLLAMFIMFWLNLNRRFLHYFVLYACAGLRLPANFQRKTIVRLHLQAVTVAFLAEPLFSIMTIWGEFIQPRVLPGLGPTSFAILRSSSILFIVIASTLIGVLHTIPPVLTCSLSCAAAQHVHLCLEKQLTRFYGTKRRRLASAHATNAQLEAELTGQDHKLLRLLTVDSLHADWPSIDGPPADPSGNTNDAQPANSRLFIYKSILKSLSELKTIAREYDRVFGNIHVTLICLNGLLEAQWIVTGVIQARHANSNSQNSFGQAHPLKVFLIRTLCRALLFAASNSILFSLCDRLPSQLRHLRAHLFRSNMELVQLVASVEAPTERSMAEAECELAWSAYDQVVWLSERANFKLTSSTYYGKHCLLLIFGREISSILLFIQLIEIYSTV